MISQEVIDRIIDEVNIAEVISEYIKIYPDGAGFKAVCPFHNDTNPSMKISVTKKIFKCFSCGAGGNVIQFVSKYEKISFNEACIKLAKRIGIELQQNYDPDYEEKQKLYKILKESNEFYRFYLQNSEEGEAALAYLANRGITQELIDRFEIGLAPSENDFLSKALTQKEIGLIEQIESGMVKKNESGEVYDCFRSRIMFPLHDQYGHIVGFSGRVYLKDDKAPKYMNSNENLVFHKSEVLYNYHQAIKEVRDEGMLFVFEGFMDVIAAARAGVNAAVATMGTALTKQHLKMLNSASDHVVLCFDGDTAGINATYKAADVFATSEVIPYAVALPEGLDPDEYEIKYGGEALKQYLRNNQLNVYDYLYNLAKRDLVKEDVVSVQRFKEKVLAFLKLANPTVKEFYLNKLASELEIDINTLLSDLRTTHVAKPAPVVVEEPKPKPKIKNNVYRAMKIVTKHSIYNRNEFVEFYDFMVDYLSFADFPDYFLIFQTLAEFYIKKDTIDVEEFKNKFFNESNEYHALEEVLEYRYSDIENHQEFIECLATMNKFVSKQIITSKREQALEDDNSIEDYMRLMRSRIHFNMS